MAALKIRFDRSASRPQSLKRGGDHFFALVSYAAVRLFALEDRSTDFPAVALISSASSVNV
jgi:hypothetical protein